MLVLLLATVRCEPALSTWVLNAALRVVHGGAAKGLQRVCIESSLSKNDQLKLRYDPGRISTENMVVARLSRAGKGADDILQFQRYMNTCWKDNKGKQEVDIKKLRQKYDDTFLKSAGFSINALLKAGCSYNELKKAGYTHEDFNTVEGDVDFLKKAGWSNEDLLRAGYSNEDPEELSNGKANGKGNGNANGNGKARGKARGKGAQAKGKATSLGKARD